MRKGTAFRKKKSTRVTIRQRVFNAIKEKRGGVSTHELRMLLGIQIHSISGRLSELEQAGLIYQKGVSLDLHNGRMNCTIWQATPKNLIEARKQENWNKRLILWLEKGKRNGFVSKKELNGIKSQTTLF